MNEVLITVFTPTYNRKFCIENCYKSLCKQTSNNFEWLIIDDGSTDNTNELVKIWKKGQTNFKIRYYWKENGGLHSAYNKGIELANTELFMCIDSDDWIPIDAIEKIEKIWKKIKKQGYVGIMGIDCFSNGKCVGEYFPKNIEEMYLYEKLTVYKTKGDKKMIHRTDLLKKVAPMPTFLGEKNFNPSYMMYQLDQFGKLYVTNECFCIVDYQPDGMSSNIFKQFKNSPNSFAETRKLYLSFPNTNILFKIKHSIHYASSCLLARKLVEGIKKAVYPILTIICLPFAVVLTFFILFKSK